LTAYYNEIDKKAAAWLRELIKENLIPYGHVDDRSIVDVEPTDLVGYAQCHFFAGVGGWGIACRLAGWPDDREIWSASCPCQPFSVAGKGAGTADARHLWPDFFRLVRARRPAAIVGEQVAAAIGKDWFDGVRTDLEGIAYACRGVVVPACAVNAPHRRDRLWFVADAKWNEQPREEPCRRSIGRMGRIEQPIPWNTSWESALASFRILDDGLPRSVAATDAARNTIVPQVAAEVIAALMETTNV